MQIGVLFSAYQSHRELRNNYVIKARQRAAICQRSAVKRKQLANKRVYSLHNSVRVVSEARRCWHVTADRPVSLRKVFIDYEHTLT